MVVQYSARRIEPLEGPDTSGRYGSILLIALWLGGVIAIAVLVARRKTSDRQWLPIKPPQGPFDGMPGSGQCATGGFCNFTGSEEESCPAFYQIFPEEFSGVGVDDVPREPPMSEYNFELPEWGTSVDAEQRKGSIGAEHILGMFDPQVDKSDARSGYKLKSVNIGRYGECNTNSTVYNLRWVKPHTYGKAPSNGLFNLSGDSYTSNIKWGEKSGAYGSSIWALGADPERVALQIEFTKCRRYDMAESQPLYVQRRLGLNGFWGIGSADVVLWPGLTVSPCVGKELGIPACGKPQGWSGLRAGPSIGLACNTADVDCKIRAEAGSFLRPKANTENGTYRIMDDPGHEGRPTAFFLKGGLRGVSSQDFLNGSIYIDPGCEIKLSLVWTFWGTWPDKFFLLAGPAVDPAPYDHAFRFRQGAEEEEEEDEEEETPYTGMDETLALDNLREFLRQICDGGENWLGSTACNYGGQALTGILNGKDGRIKYFEDDPCDSTGNSKGCPTSNSDNCRSTLFSALGWGGAVITGGDRQGSGSTSFNKSSWDGCSVEVENEPSGVAKYPLPPAFVQARTLAQLGVPCWRCDSYSPLDRLCNGNDLDLPDTANAKGGPYRNGGPSTDYPRAVRNLHWIQSGYTYIGMNGTEAEKPYGSWKGNIADLRYDGELEGDEPEELCLANREGTCRNNLCRQGYVAVDRNADDPDPNVEPDYECEVPSVPDGDELDERLLRLNPCKPITMKLTGTFWLEYCPRP